MFNINALRENRARAWEQAKTFLDEHRTENGTLSAEDAAQYERMEADVVNLGKEIERMERGAALDAELARPVGSPLTNRPGAGNDNKTGRASDAYKSAFLNGLRTRFRSVNDVLSTGTDASGGYLVPEEWDSRLIEKLEQENIVRKLGTVIQTSGDRRINVTASLPTASWVEENAEITTSDPSWSQARLDSFKLVAATRISEELLQDNAYDLGSVLIDQLGRSLARGEEEGFLVGNGDNKPYGILHPTYGGEIGVTAASPTALTVDEVIDLVYKLKRPYRANAAFIMADSTLAAIRKLKQGTGDYLWQPALTAGEPDRLLGYPVYTSPYVPAIAAGQPVVGFGDFSFVNIADRGTRSFATLTELYAMSGQVAFKATERVDSRLILPEAVQILKMKGTAQG